MKHTRTLTSFIGLLLLTFNLPMVLLYLLVDVPGYMHWQSPLESTNDLNLLAILCAIVTLFLLIPCSLVLIARLHYNASQIAQPRYSRNLTLFSFFIPILNLFRPYQAMKDLWYSSQVFEKNKKGHLPFFLIWWIPFVLSFMLPVAEAIGPLGKRSEAPIRDFGAVTVEVLSWLAMSAAFYYIVNRIGTWLRAATSHNSM